MHSPHEIVISVINCPENWNEPRPKKDKLPDVFEALRKVGFKFTSFEEKVG